MITTQPKINIGIIGHVDHGKTTLTKLLSGVWTDNHSEERKRGITIKLGYTNFSIFQNGEEYTVKNENNDSNFKKICNYSIVDSPGHESFMATMISGASVMDYAILLVDASIKCPQPQTIEHIKALEISNCKKIIVVQNKIDLIEKEAAIKNFNEIKEFLDTTKFSGSSIIPLSAQYGSNLSSLLKYVYKEFEVLKRDENETLIFNTIRSFDINKPGSTYDKLNGGVLGCSIKCGKITVGDKLEIKPGIPMQKNGKVGYQPIIINVVGLKTDKSNIEVATPGGSIAILTNLDPILTKKDVLVGQIGSLKGNLKEPVNEVTIDINILKTIITSAGETKIKPLIVGENLMMIINSFTTIGEIKQINSNKVILKLKRPIIVFNKDKLVIFRQMEQKKWKIIGYGNVYEK